MKKKERTFFPELRVNGVTWSGTFDKGSRAYPLKCRVISNVPNTYMIGTLYVVNLQLPEYMRVVASRDLLRGWMAKVQDLRNTLQNDVLQVPHRKPYMQAKFASLSLLQKQFTFTVVTIDHDVDYNLLKEITTFCNAELKLFKRDFRLAYQKNTRVLKLPKRHFPPSE